MIRDSHRASLVLWLALVLVMMVVFVQRWRPVESEASKTAAQVSVKRMLERANLYKQEWLLQGKPKQIEMDGQSIPLSTYGWVPLIGENGQLDCQRWLDFHSPERRILESHLTNVSESKINETYQCQFNYQNGLLIVVSQQHKILKISVENMAE